jgi:hypothetical protein
MEHEQAQDLATEVLDTTQYDYSPENRPMILQHPTARVMLQFRQFAQQTAWQIGKIINQSMDKNLTPEQRREQKTYLLYLLASTFTLAGIRGMPAAGMILILASALFGDEGDDLEVSMQQQFKETFGDVFGPMMTDGVFSVFGIDASRNIGLGDLIPGTNVSNRATVGGRDRIKNMLFDMAGPTMAMAGNWANGYDTAQRGDLYRGIEEGLPKAFRTPMTAYRQSQRGMETKNGVVRIKDSDLSSWDFFITAIGLKTQKVSQVQGKVRVIQGQEDALKFRSGLIRRKIQLARRMDDIDGEMEGLLELQEFNEKYPQFRITRQSLKPNALKRAQRQAELTGGAANTKRQRKLWEAFMDDEDDEL